MKTLNYFKHCSPFSRLFSLFYYRNLYNKRLKQYFSFGWSFRNVCHNKNFTIPENVSVGLFSSAGLIFLRSFFLSSMVLRCSAKTGILDGRGFPSLSTDVQSLETFHFFSVSSSDEEVCSLSLAVFLTGILDFRCIGGRRILLPPPTFSLAYREAIANGSQLSPRERITFSKVFPYIFSLCFFFMFFFSFLNIFYIFSLKLTLKISKILLLRN